MYKSITTNLMVNSVDKAITFYKDVLGFEVPVTVPGKNNEFQFAILSKDNFSLMLQEKSNLIEEYPVLQTDRVQPSITIYIAVDNLDSLYEEIKSKHPINTEMHTSFYGAREFAVIDIDGYVLTFTDFKEM